MSDKKSGPLDWVETRLGLSGGPRRWFSERATTSASWRRAIAATLFGLFAVECLTGVLLAFFYSPSSTDAWASVVYIEEQVALGSLLRGVHHWGMSATILVALAHITVTFTAGLYKKPREVNWWLMIAIALLLVGFSLTGLTLVYDQSGFWASQVETEIMAGVPVVGAIQRELLLGGNDYGNLTLTRFYALHGLVLPGLLLGLFAAFFKLERHYDAAAPPAVMGSAKGPLASQVFRNLLGVTIATATLVILSAILGAPLSGPADPTQAFDARPEWYFMPMYVGRKMLPASMEMLATVVIPSLVIGLLVLLPLLDRNPERALSRRRAIAIPFFAGLLAFFAMVVVGKVKDGNNKQHQEALKIAVGETNEALRLVAQGGGVPLNPSTLIQNDPKAWGAQLFDQHCSSCHALGTGEGSGPDLGGWGSRAWLTRFLQNPRHPNFYGKIEPPEGKKKSIACSMKQAKDYGLSDDDVATLVDGLLINRGDHAPKGIKADAGVKMLGLAKEKKCQTCHHFEAEGADAIGSINGEGPDLSAYGSAQWSERLLIWPEDGSHYGKGNQMPTYAEKLDRAERAALRVFMMSLADTKLAPFNDPDFNPDFCAPAKAKPDPVDPPKDPVDPPKDPVDPPKDPVDPTATTRFLLDNVTVTLDPAKVEAGSKLFVDNCQSCHLVDGKGGDDGEGPELTAWGSEVWLSAFLANPNHASFYGGSDFEDVMQPLSEYELEEKEEVAAILDGLMLNRSVNPLTEADKATQAKWIEVFEEYSCVGCHQLTIGETAMGGDDSSGPPLTRYGSAEWLKALLEEPDAASHYGELNAMPPFADQLEEEELDQVIHYMMSLHSQPPSEAIKGLAESLLSEME